MAVPPALLQPGSAGDGVTRLQCALVAIGALQAADVLAEGGSYGPSSTAATAWFQREMDLGETVGGVYDDRTAASLSSLVDARGPVAMASGAGGAGTGGDLEKPARTADGEGREVIEYGCPAGWGTAGDVADGVTAPV